MPGKPWTQEERSVVRDLVELGYTKEEIAAELADRFPAVRTVSAVQCLMGREGWRSQIVSQPNAAARSKLVALLEVGMNLGQIAKRIGRHPASVVRMARLMAKEGLLVRTGGMTNNVRYKPSLKWTRGEGGE